MMLDKTQQDGGAGRAADDNADGTVWQVELRDVLSEGPDRIRGRGRGRDDYDRYESG